MLYIDMKKMKISCLSNKFTDDEREKLNIWSQEYALDYISSDVKDKLKYKQWKWALVYLILLGDFRTFLIFVGNFTGQNRKWVYRVVKSANEVES